jgi:DNA repair photolyase
MDLLAPAGGVSVGLTVPTDDDAVRKILEPNAPPIAGRIAALKKLREAGVDTWAFIGPMLPMNPERLYEALSPFVNRVLIDSLHYRSKVADLYERRNWGYALSDGYALEMERALRRLFGKKAETA